MISHSGTGLDVCLDSKYGCGEGGVKKMKIQQYK